MLRLSRLFGDHAVLQRNRAIPVWGWTEPFEIVEGRLGDMVAMTRAGDDGKFELRFPPHSADGPLKLEVKVCNSGEKIVSHDIMIGEVWVASGQSNMEFLVSSLTTQCGVVQAEAGKYPTIRMQTVPKRAQTGWMTDTDSDWEVASEDTVLNWSAVGYYFARELQRELNVPIGIIASSWGGTIAEAWSSRQVLSRNPDFAAKLELMDRNFNDPKIWAEATPYDLSVRYTTEKVMLEQLIPSCPETLDKTGSRATLDYDDSDWEYCELPNCWSSWGLNINGVVWFRREIEIPKDWEGKELRLHFGSIDKQDVAYFNGVEVGRTGSGLETQHWCLPRDYRIPAELVKAGKAVITVRNYSFIYDGGIRGNREDMKLSLAGKKNASLIPLAGTWKYDIEFQYPRFDGRALQIGSPHVCSRLFDNMIRPLIPMAIRGVIWYQGESNDKAPECYERLMTDLITDWRYQWGQGDFPFLQVSLAGFRASMPYDPDSAWAYIREAQSKSTKTTGNLLASALDLGDPTDIHPQRKEEVGRRLALAALEQAYGQPVTGSGPVYREMVREENSIRIWFDHIGNGLTAHGQELRGFVIAGLNGVFHEAQARIIENSVRVFSPEVPDPVAVRYAWSDNPEVANLYNGAGLPAIPFRTDNFPR